MPNATCSVSDCSTVMKPDQRLRKGFCPKHYQRYRKDVLGVVPAVKPAPEPVVAACRWCCSEYLKRGTRHVYCSDQCRWNASDAREGLTCFICNKAMQGGSTSKPQGEAAHNACRVSVGGLRKHGQSAYRAGCRCDVCRSELAAKARAYGAKYRAENGVAISTVSRRKFREENGYWPNRRGSDWIDPKLRLEIYERDGWTCHICSDPIDRDAHWNDNFAPSLDHLNPKSLGGSHEPENLKTAHRVCNSVKGATYEFV